MPFGTKGKLLLIPPSDNLSGDIDLELCYGVDSGVSTTFGSGSVTETTEAFRRGVKWESCIFICAEEKLRWGSGGSHPCPYLNALV